MKVLQLQDHHLMKAPQFLTITSIIILGSQKINSLKM